MCQLPHLGGAIPPEHKTGRIPAVSACWEPSGCTAAHLTALRRKHRIHFVVPWCTVAHSETNQSESGKAGWSSFWIKKQSKYFSLAGAIWMHPNPHPFLCPDEMEYSLTLPSFGSNLKYPAGLVLNVRGTASAKRFLLLTEREPECK